MASMVAAEFTIMGIGKAQALDEAETHGRETGFHLGFAAGATGADAAWVFNTLAQPLVGLPNADGVLRAHNSAFVSAMFKGWEEASALTLEQKIEYQKCVLETAAAQGAHWQELGGIQRRHTNHWSSAWPTQPAKLRTSACNSTQAPTRMLLLHISTTTRAHPRNRA